MTHSLHFDLPKCTPILSMRSLLSLRSSPSLILFYFPFSFSRKLMAENKVKKRILARMPQQLRTSPGSEHIKYTTILKQLRSVHNLYERGAMEILHFELLFLGNPHAPPPLQTSACFQCPPPPKKQTDLPKVYLKYHALPPHRHVKLFRGENVLSPLFLVFNFHMKKIEEILHPLYSSG